MQPHESGPRKRNLRHSAHEKRRKPSAQMKRLTTEELIAEAEEIAERSRRLEIQARNAMPDIFTLSMCDNDDCNFAALGAYAACQNGHNVVTLDVPESLFRIATAHLN